MQFRVFTKVQNVQPAEKQEMKDQLPNGGFAHTSTSTIEVTAESNVTVVPVYNIIKTNVHSSGKQVLGDKLGFLSKTCKAIFIKLCINLKI